MKRYERLSEKTAYVYFVLAGWFFVFCEWTERSLAETGNIVWTPGAAFRILGSSAALGGLLGGAVCFLFCMIARGKLERLRFFRWAQAGWGLGKQASGRRKPYVFLGSLLCIMCAWLPAYLAYYPAICTYDSPSQIGQITEGYMIDHHPIAHTLFIKAAMLFGEKALGSVNAGMGVYALAQQLLLAAAFAFGVTLLWRLGVRKIWLLLLQIFCMFYPFHLYMSVSVTKDTIFSGFFLVMILTLGWMLSDGKEGGTTFLRKLLFFLSSIGVILFRNNGKYAYLALLAVLLAALAVGKKTRRFWAELFLWASGAFAAGMVILAALFEATDAQQGDRREMLSIPIQQLARTMIYHGGAGVLPQDDNTMNETDKALINDFLLYESYKRYNPVLADPVKGSTNTYVARYRTGDFLKTYLHLFIQYPGDYVNAALAVNAGYLSPDDVTHAYVNVSPGTKNMGYAATRWVEGTLNEKGIYKASLWPGLFEKMERWADENKYLELPVLKYLFVPGSWLYFYLLLLGWLVLVREKRLCAVYSVLTGYYLTLFLGPAVQLRYIYPMMIVFPFLLLLYNGKAKTASGEPPQ